MKHSLSALFLMLMIGGGQAEAAETASPSLAPQVEAEIKVQETIATNASFPPAFIVGEITKGIRSKLYAADITPAQMLQVLDEVSSTPLTRFGKEAVSQIRKEIDAG